VNLAGRKAGLAPGAEDERDPEQLRLAIEAVRSLLPHVEELLGDDANAIREAISQLQMAYTQSAGAEGAAGTPEGGAPSEPSPDSSGRGAAQSSGRLWVPGQ
jgi:hypothetical protein